MPRHARTRTAGLTASARRCPAARTAGSASAEPDPGRARAEERRQAELGDPLLLGVVTSAADHARLAARGGLSAPDHRGYLREVEAALRDAVRGGHEVYGRRFHPGDLDAWCAEHGVRPGSRGSHRAYIEDPEGEPDWVRWTGGRLPEFLAALDRAHERGSVHRGLDRMLGATAEAAAAGGSFPEALLRPAYAAGVRALCDLLGSAAPGVYRLACAADGAEGRIGFCAALELGAGERMSIEEADLDALCALLCTAHVLGLNAGLLLNGRTADGRSAARGWSFDGRGYHRRCPLDLLDGFDAPLAARVAVPAAPPSPGAAATLRLS